MQKHALPASFKKVVLGSLVVHLAVVLTLVVAVDAHSGPQEPENVVLTKLVRLGKKRPEHMLPRLPKEAPPPAPTPKRDEPTKPKPAPKEAPKAAPKAKPSPMAKPAPQRQSAAERTKQLKNTASALDRLRNSRKKSDSELEGEPDGSQAGTVSSISLAIIGNKYMNEVHQCIQANWAIEGVDPSRIRGLSASVWVRISSSGKLADHRIEQSSGVSAFDRAVEKAIRRCNQVSRPPREIRKRILQYGIEIEFRPAE